MKILWKSSKEQSDMVDEKWQIKQLTFIKRYCEKLKGHKITTHCWENTNDENSNMTSLVTLKNMIVENSMNGTKEANISTFENYTICFDTMIKNCKLQKFESTPPNNLHRISEQPSISMKQDFKNEETNKLMLTFSHQEEDQNSSNSDISSLIDSIDPC